MILIGQVSHLQRNFAVRWRKIVDVESTAEYRVVRGRGEGFEQRGRKSFTGGFGVDLKDAWGASSCLVSLVPDNVLPELHEVQASPGVCLELSNDAAINHEHPPER